MWKTALSVGWGLAKGGLIGIGGLLGVGTVAKTDVGRGITEDLMSAVKNPDAVTDTDHKFTGIARFIQNIMKLFSNLGNIIKGEANLTTLFTSDTPTTKAGAPNNTNNAPRNTPGSDNIVENTMEAGAEIVNEHPGKVALGAGAATLGTIALARKMKGSKAGDAPDVDATKSAETPDTKAAAGYSRTSADADAPDAPKADTADTKKPKVGGKLGRLFALGAVTTGVVGTAMTYSPQSHAAGSIDPNKAADIPQTGTEYLKQEGGSQIFEAVTDALPFGEATKAYLDGNTAEALDSAMADTGGLVGAFAAGAGAGALFGGVGAIPGALIGAGGYVAGEYIGDKLGDVTITEAVADKFDSVADAAGTKLASMKDSLVSWFNDEADPQTAVAMNYKQPAPAWNLN